MKRSKRSLNGKMNKLLSMIGLAYKAGKVRFGSDSVIESVRSVKKPDLVIASSDISEKTLKKLTDGCEYHGVKLVRINDGMSELGRAAGGRSELACIAVLDKGFAVKLIELSGDCAADSK